MREIILTSDARQQISEVINGVTVNFNIWYNGMTDRWTIAAEVAGVVVFEGRKLVAGVDLLAPFDLGLGLMLLGTVVAGSVPDRDAFVDGKMKLYLASEADLAQVSS